MIRAFQWDLARQIEQLDFLQSLLPRYAAWGYQELYLHLEDAVHYPSLPGIGRKDAYTYQELGELVLAAGQNGIRVVPIVNLLGHTQYLIKHPEWRELNERRNAAGLPLESGQLCPLHPRTAELAEKLLRDMVPYCTAGKMHVGLDESFHLGQCPRCREEVARIGLGGHFAGHASRLHQLCRGLGLQMGLWADMLYFVPEAIPLLPRGITAYDWYYYPFNRKPRVEFFNFAERDLHPALKKQGISYYGCPMNGAFRHEPLPVFGDRLGNIHSWWKRVQAVEAEGMLITSWEANRLALEATTVVDAAAASLWLDPSVDDATSWLSAGLRRAAGTTESRPLARLLLSADEHAFAGYARWQINDRWDVFAGTESIQPYRSEERFFARLQSGGRRWPRAFAASLAFRHYLAQRDVFVREMAREVFKWRRLLAKAKSQAVIRSIADATVAAAAFAPKLSAGLKAARQMWTRTRNPEEAGPNQRMVAANRQKLAEWRRWLRQASRQPGLIWQATPVCGAWQLQFMVHNFAPAVQRVVIEQKAADGTWHELAGRHTIEFRALAARPHTKLKREFTLPVSSPDLPLRIAVHGVGQVAISHVQLTNGSESRRSRRFSRQQVLGQRAPTRGWPVFVTVACAGSKSIL